MVPPEPKDNLRLEIGHVLFIDIVGYSRLLIEEQKERLHQLTEIVLATAPVCEATGEQLVRLPTGDGIAPVFGRSAEEPDAWRSERRQLRHAQAGSFWGSRSAAIRASRSSSPRRRRKSRSPNE